MPTPLLAVMLPLVVLVMPPATVAPLIAIPAKPVPVLVIDPLLVTPPVTLAAPPVNVKVAVPCLGVARLNN